MPLAVLGGYGYAEWYPVEGCFGSYSLRVGPEMPRRRDRAVFQFADGCGSPYRVAGIGVGRIYQELCIGYGEEYPCIRKEWRKPEKRTIDIIFPIDKAGAVFCPEDQMVTLVPCQRRTTAVTIRCYNSPTVVWYVTPDEDLAIIIVGRDRVFSMQSWIDASKKYASIYGYDEGIPKNPEKRVGDIR